MVRSIPVWISVVHRVIMRDVGVMSSQRKVVPRTDWTRLL